MHLPSPTETRTSKPTSQRIDPYARPERSPHQRVTVTGRVGQGRRATVKGTSWNALMDDNAPTLLRKCRTAAAIELRTQDRDRPDVIDVADEVYLQCITRAARETCPTCVAAPDPDTCKHHLCATTWPREETTRMSYLRLEARGVIRKTMTNRQAREVTGVDHEELARETRDHAEKLRVLSIDDATRAADDAAAILGLSSRGDVWTMVYDALRGEEGTTIAAELEITLDALKGKCKRARAVLANAYPTPAALISTLHLMDDADAGSDRTKAKLDWAPRMTAAPDEWRDAGSTTARNVGTFQLILPIRWSWEQTRAMRNAEHAGSLPNVPERVRIEADDPAQLSFTV